MQHSDGETTTAELSTIVDAIPTAIVVVNSTGMITMVNSRAEEMFGYASDELIGEPIEILVPPKFRQSHYASRAGYDNAPRLRPMGARRELFGLHKNGGEFPVEIGLSPIATREGVLVLSAIFDTSERAQQAKDLHEYADKLAISNRELDDFAYIVSHDLKEPLRGIHSYASFLIEDYEDKLDDEGKRKLQTLMRLTGRLEDLLDSLLFYSRVGRTDLAKQETNVNQLAHQILESMDIFLQERGAHVTVLEELPATVCDSVRVGEVFRNLITNAVKYNDQVEKRVEIGWKPASNGKPVYFVRDNGIGISEKHRERIFTMFKRLHARDKYGGGTGSGLTITRKIVEQHGGRIWLDSVVDAGSTFYFTLAENTSVDAAAQP